MVYGRAVRKRGGLTGTIDLTHGSLRSRALAATLAAPLRRALPAFLPSRRWFAGKGRTIAAAAVEDLAALGDEEAGEVALALTRVDYVVGEPECYALLLAVVDDPRSLPLIATCDDGRAIVEAAGAPFAVRTLVHAARTTAAGASLRWDDVAPAAISDADLAVDAIRPLAAEQSNSSIRIGDGLLLKLFRVVTPGANPEVEMGRVLSAARFPATAALRASLAYVAADGGERTLAVLQEWRANDGDGWTWVLAVLRRLAQEPSAATMLAGAIRELGRTTAALHATVAAARDAAFVPEPVTAADVAAWTAAVRARAAALWPRLTAAAAGLDARARALVTEVSARRAALDRLATPPAIDGGGAFVKIRIHGDYHLGQTLRGSEGFLVIDFEGEPARPLAERRAKHCALKDVAGMLRSFAYACEVARVEVEPLLRDAFLAGYVEGAGSAAFLPAAAAARRGWIDLFEVEKALYEVEYELDHRPEWTHIPLRGVARILAGG